jgi:hypothetical protein
MSIMTSGTNKREAFSPMRSQSQIIAAAIDAAFSVIQAEHDPLNRFDGGSAGDDYSVRFPQFQTLVDCLEHYADWEANRVKAAAAQLKSE